MKTAMAESWTLLNCHKLPLKNENFGNSQIMGTHGSNFEAAKQLSYFSRNILE